MEIFSGVAAFGTDLSLQEDKDTHKEIEPKEERYMKRTLQTLIMAVFVVLITASFSFAEYVASTAGNFPYFQLGCLVVGGLIITSLKHKYSKIYMSEAVGSFALYAVLVALFTAPVVDALKSLVS